VEDYSSKEVSEFNENAFSIARLHEIKEAGRRARESGNLIKYSEVLDSMEIELRYDSKKIDKAEKTTFASKLDNVNKKIISAKLSKKLGNYYSALREKDILLREIQEESGKGTRYKSMDEDDWD